MDIFIIEDYNKKILNKEKEIKLMGDRNCVVSGEKIFVCSLCDSNKEDYLSVFKRASVFSDLYEKNSDLWDFFRKDMEKFFKSGEDNIARYLIMDRDTYIAAGYINLTYNVKEKPEVDIAIVKEYRRKGYAFEAAKLLIKHLFEKGEIKSVVWSAFSSNTASCRIAEKLGGVLIDGKNLIREAILNAGYTFEYVNLEETLLKTVTYEIKKNL